MVALTNRLQALLFDALVTLFALRGQCPLPAGLAVSFPLHLDKTDELETLSTLRGRAGETAGTPALSERGDEGAPDLAAAGRTDWNPAAGGCRVHSSSPPPRSIRFPRSRPLPSNATEPWQATVEPELGSAAQRWNCCRPAASRWQQCRLGRSCRWHCRCEGWLTEADLF